MIHNPAVENFAQWQQAARILIAARVSPDAVQFTNGSQSALFAESESLRSPRPDAAFTVPKSFLEIAHTVAMHRSPQRWNLLYEALYRIVIAGERNLLSVEVDPGTRELMLMRSAVERDIHKMHAFVRFRKISDEPEQYVAWHRPDHYIVEHVAPWFVSRFGAMRWAILTPDRSAFWDTNTLSFGAGIARSEAPDHDDLEDLWRTYYASVFNPARANLDATVRELPVRHWATLPEAALIPRLLQEASAKEGDMRAQKPASAEPFIPPQHDLPVLAKAIHQCHGCDLYRYATQPVFGEGPGKARVMFVGEQPGDQEDIQGKPFVGPAGRILNQALLEAEIDRSEVYVSNAVKHFKFEERGKRRLHKKPTGPEVAACRPWLTAEIEQVNPRFIVALGATAALSVGGREFAIQKERGKLMPFADDRQLLITVHPSFLLRVRDPDREVEYSRFVKDLRLISAGIAGTKR